VYSQTIFRGSYVPDPLKRETEEMSWKKEEGGRGGKGEEMDKEKGRN
jgi:hypothetical protein